MKRFTLILQVVCLFTYGCGALYNIPVTGSYDVDLVQLERPEDAKERYGESTIINFQEDGDTKYKYADEMIEIAWVIGQEQFSFVLNNKTEHSIKLIWDEAAYVDLDNASKRIMHSGVKYNEKNNSQPASIIIKGGKLTDIIQPTENVYYINGSQYYSGGWRTLPLFPNSGQDKEALINLSKQYIGREVKILLPLEIQGNVNEYIFSFKLENFNIPPEN